LEQRVARLEARVNQLQKSLGVNGKGSQQGWRKAVDKFAGDADLQSIFAEAMKLREADRKRVRRPRAKSRKSSQ
jgi:hypothetical protein